MDPRTKIILDVASTAAHFAIKQVRKAKESKKLISTKNLDKAKVVADSVFTVLSAFSDGPSSRALPPTSGNRATYDLMEEDAAGNYVPTQEMFRQLKKLQAKLAHTQDMPERAKLLKKINAIYALVLDDNQNDEVEDSQED